ncbi:hypothetical protein K504DRAFT_530235 [Pleomassaria siparia CBS 279.74]|uniref:Uncharacterized protein n=1 Tax=Pleomassaria siparia CBS 279.74 TaxID=1314801 RepID=A0A6G1KL47_9PLEO|nr:hypothetical protein K504DRAFT_530235 [Pleomassaria siparia CBS 279.74]
MTVPKKAARGKVKARSRRSLVSKLPPRPGVSKRRGKAMPKINSKPKISDPRSTTSKNAKSHKPLIVHLPSGNNSESEDGYQGRRSLNTRGGLNPPSTPPLLPTLYNHSIPTSENPTTQVGTQSGFFNKRISLQCRKVPSITNSMSIPGPRSRLNAATPQYDPRKLLPMKRKGKYKLATMETVEEVHLPSLSSSVRSEGIQNAPPSGTRLISRYTPSVDPTVRDTDEEDDPPIHHRRTIRTTRTRRTITSGNSYKRQLGATQNNPLVIESDSNIVEVPNSRLRKKRSCVPSKTMRDLNEEEKMLPPSPRKAGRSTYCKPTSRKPGVRDLQVFISDNESDRESIESFCEDDDDEDDNDTNNSGSDNGSDGYDTNPDEMAEELADLTIGMDYLTSIKKKVANSDDYGYGTATGEHKRKRGGNFHDTRHSTLSDIHIPRHGQCATPSKRQRYRQSQTACGAGYTDGFDGLDDRNTDDEEELFNFTEFANTPKRVITPRNIIAPTKGHILRKPRTPVHSFERSGGNKVTESRWSLSLSPTPSLLEFDFNSNRDKAIPSIEPSKRKLGYQSRK